MAVCLNEENEPFMTFENVTFIYTFDALLTDHVKIPSFVL